MTWTHRPLFPGFSLLNFWRKFLIICLSFSSNTHRHRYTRRWFRWDIRRLSSLCCYCLGLGHPGDSWVDLTNSTERRVWQGFRRPFLSIRVILKHWLCCESFGWLIVVSREVSNTFFRYHQCIISLDTLPLIQITIRLTVNNTWDC